MSVITVSGNISQVREQLQRLSEVIKNREVLGFPSLVHEAEWMYIGMRDERECDGLCMPLNYTVIRGDNIPRRFPYYNFKDDRHIAVNRHKFCRCELEAVNVGEFTEEQLHQEKLSVL